MASYRLGHGPVKDVCLHSNLQSQDRTQKGPGGCPVAVGQPPGHKTKLKRHGCCRYDDIRVLDDLSLDLIKSLNSADDWNNENYTKILRICRYFPF